MCGIFASLRFEPDPRHIDIVQHRGPDGRGWREYATPVGPLALGHRRLSILDLDVRSAQPMTIGEGRYWITYNGEIYNFVELRAELEALGVVFHTTSDTEVLLQAYAVWGEDMLQRLLGMFALVLYDAKAQRLFVARDRFGIKPLYYFNSPKGLAFGSEIKQLVDLPGFSRSANLPRLYDFLSDGYSDHTEETMFADARQLRGGQCLTLDLASFTPGAPLPVRRYYDLPRSAGPALSEADAAKGFFDLFEDSVRIHMRSDVRVGSCLSGGLDSSAIVMVMDQLLRQSGAPEPIHTVSACYDDKAVDEKPYMDQVVAATRSEPHFIYPSAERAVDILERMVWHQDEPFYNTSMYAQWCVFEEAARHKVKVMLDGQGADEQLAGYHHESFPLQAGTLLRGGDLAGLGRMLTERKRWHGVSYRSQLLAIPGRPRMPAWVSRARAPAARTPGADWLQSEKLAGAHSGLGALADLSERDAIGPVEDIGSLGVANLLGGTLSRLLRWEDRNSMAHSIEARLPFLDHRLVEFNVRLWNQHKVVGGDTKRVLRAAMKGLMPEPVRVRRDKLGFATPQETWFRGPLRAAMETGIRDTLEVFPDLFNKGEVLAGLEAAMDGRRSADAGLWMLLNLGTWGRVFGMKA